MNEKCMLNLASLNGEHATRRPLADGATKAWVEAWEAEEFALHGNLALRRHFLAYKARALEVKARLCCR